MNVKLENIEKNVVQLEIEIDAEKFDEGMEKAYKKNRNKFFVQGFRKGKVPRNIVERVYGEQVLYEDAVNFVCPEAYDEAIKEKGLNPVDRPEVDIVNIGKGDNFVFTAKVTVKPDVELGKYKEIEVEKEKTDVTDDDVEKEIQKEAEKNARMVTVEDRAVEKGDTVNIDFEGFIDNEPFEGGKAENHDLEIGSGQFIPGFEDQLTGAGIGDDVEVNVTFPEDYNSEELAGKSAVFKVKINGIQKKILPEIDDEFAKEVSEFDTLEEYKDSIKKKLVEEAEKNAKQQTENKIIKKIVENAKMDIPQVMIKNRIDQIMREFEMSLSYRGMNLENYYKLTGTDEETFKKQYAERAEEDVKTQLVIEKITKEENITADDEKLQKEIERMAETYKQTAEDFKKHLKDEDIEYIRENLNRQKTVDFLVENAKVS